jgi:hypothetical protein
VGADEWRYEYLSDQLRDNTKRLEDAEKILKSAQSELAAAEWQRDKYKAIVEMLEVAYKVNVTKKAEVIDCIQKDEANK